MIGNIDFSAGLDRAGSSGGMGGPTEGRAANPVANSPERIDRLRRESSREEIPYGIRAQLRESRD